MNSNRRILPTVTIGLYGDVVMTRGVYVALVLSCAFVGAVIGASIVGLVWLL